MPLAGLQLQDKADLNAVDDDNSTPLMVAAGLTNMEVASALGTHFEIPRGGMVKESLSREVLM